MADRTFLRNSSGELRSGWKLSVFLLLTAAFTMASLLLLKLLGEEEASSRWPSSSLQYFSPHW